MRRASQMSGEHHDTRASQMSGEHHDTRASHMVRERPLWEQFKNKSDIGVAKWGVCFVIISDGRQRRQTGSRSRATVQHSQRIERACPCRLSKSPSGYLHSIDQPAIVFAGTGPRVRLCGYPVLRVQTGSRTLPSPRQTEQASISGDPPARGFYGEITQTEHGAARGSGGVTCN